MSTTLSSRDRRLAIGLPEIRDDAYKRARAYRECEDWEAALVTQRKKPSTRRDYAYTVWDLLEQWPDKAVEEFTTGDIEQQLARYPDAGRDTRRAHLNSFFRYLKRRRLIPENPMEFMEPVRRAKPRLPDIFTEAEVSLLCGLPTPDGELMTILFETGLRKSEACNLVRRHIQLNPRRREAGELIVWGGKGDKDRIIPLATPGVLKAIADLDLFGLQMDDYLWYSKPGGRGFISRSRPISAWTFGRWWRNCVDASGVRYRNPHTARHTFATDWRKRGLDLDELQLVLGHASIVTTRDLYVHTTIHDVARRMVEIAAGVS
jgi:integrase/recombinase XerC